MKIFMAGSPNDGVGWWRMEMASRVLTEAGHETITPPSMKQLSPENVITYYAGVLQNDRPDIVWCGRLDRTTVSLFRQAARFDVKARVFDLDDLLHDLPDDNPAQKKFDTTAGGHRKIFDAIMSQSDAVSVTTPFLRDYYTDWKDGLGPKAIICPNVVDLNEIKRKWSRSDKRLRVGMIYNTNRHGDFIPLLGPLTELINEDKIHLTLFGSFAEHFWGVSPKSIRWIKHTPPDRYWRNMSTSGVDVILSRLKPHDFNLAKSNIKWLEATAIGAVTVTTTFGEMTDLPGTVQMPVDDNPDLWKTTLESLADEKRNGTLRETIDRSMQAVKERWSTTSPKAIAQWQEVIDHVELHNRGGRWDRGVVTDDIRDDEGERS